MLEDLVPQLEVQLASPTPLASAVWSMGLLAALGTIYFLVTLFRGRRVSKRTETIGDKVSDAIRSADSWIVEHGSYLTGTRYQTRGRRLLVLLPYFATLALLGAFLPWPWALLPITLGVFSIFVVFRHYSIDEDERLDDVKPSDKKIRIDGDLHVEVLAACAFLFVFAPTAFAILQENGFGFKIAQDSGPFTFIVYTFIEAVKAGSLLDYYDLWAESLGWAKVSGLEQPTLWAKWGVLAYRLSLTVLLLAALKRLFDIARRKAEGRDLRHLEEILKDGTEEEHGDAVDELKRFALRGRGNARDLLERILQPAKDDAWSIGPLQRSRAADALQAYARIRGVSSALAAAISGYQRLAREDWSRDKDAENWATTQNDLGAALQSLGRQTGDNSRFDEAITAYRAALEVHTRETMPADWAGTQHNLGIALNMQGEFTNDPKRIQEAIAAYRAALEVYTRETMPEEWARTQHNLALALYNTGAQTHDAEMIREAISSLRDLLELEVRSRDKHSRSWAGTNIALGNALRALSNLTNENKQTEEAISLYRSALEIITREEAPFDWALAYHNLGHSLLILARRQRTREHFEQSIAAFRKALQIRSYKEMPSLWAGTMWMLGEALEGLGTTAEDTKRLEEAIAVQREVIELIDRAKIPGVWARSQSGLGDALAKIGAITDDAKRKEEAIAAYRAALEVYTRESMPEEWARTQNNLGAVFQSLGELTGDSSKYDEAIAAFRAVLDVYAHESRPGEWAALNYSIGLCFVALGEQRSDPSQLQTAIQHFRNEQEIVTKDTDAEGWAITQHLIAMLLNNIGFMKKDRQTLADAKAAVLEALEVKPDERDFTDTLKEIENSISSLQNGINQTR